MATYAIGDLHGDLAALERLLPRLDFDPRRDRLWFVGDLVNRGPDSLGCLRFVRGLGESAVTVLGNHDLALLIRARRTHAGSKINSSLAPVFEAADSESLLEWLRHQPLIHSDHRLGWTMVHAGIAAEWSVPEARQYAGELEDALRGPGHDRLLANLKGNTPALWHNTLTGYDRLRYITNALTRQRFVDPEGRLDMSQKTTLEAAPASLSPWFTQPDRRSADQRVVFGHWSALTPVAWPQHNVWCIDTGAASGGHLTALRLDTAPETISVPG